MELEKLQDILTRLADTCYLGTPPIIWLSKMKADISSLSIQPELRPTNEDEIIWILHCDGSIGQGFWGKEQNEINKGCLEMGMVGPTKESMEKRREQIKNLK